MTRIPDRCERLLDAKPFGRRATVGSGGTPPRREARSRSLAKSSLGQDESPTRREGAARVIGRVHPERVQGP